MAESSYKPEPKTLAEDTDLPAQTRARSLSSGTRRSSYYDQQRIEKRPSSGPGQPGPSASASASSSSRPKGKRSNVEFQDVNEDIIPPPLPRQDTGPHLEGAVRRSQDLPPGDSYTNFSRPDAARRHSTKSKRKSDPGAGLSETAAPVPVEDRSDQAKRQSATSTVGKRSAPVDVEHGWRQSEDGSAPVPPFMQRFPGEYLPGKKELPPPAPPWLRELYIISYLVFFSLLGTLARAGTEWIAFYPGAPIVTPIVWANFGGSLFMGFLSEDKRLFQDEWSSTTTTRSEKRQSKQSKRSTHSQDYESLQKGERAKIKKAIPLYIGLAVGFCGSFTSFAVFARDMFLALSNDLPTPVNHPYSAAVSPSSTVPRSGGYTFEAIVAVIITTLALSIGGLIMGAHIALYLEDFTPRIPTRFTRLFLDRFMVFLGWGCWLGAVFLAIWPPDRPGGPVSSGDWAHETWRGNVVLSLVFAPVGCLLRYYASLKLNGLVPSFPLGTFAVNMLGSAVLAMCWDVQHVGVGVGGAVGGGLVSCQVLVGVQDGLCGCLTTVSTWVAEINALRRRHAWQYASASIVGAFCLMVAIMGSVRWGVGWSDPVCATGYPSKY